MARDDNIENLFKDHSLEEIESVRDNLAIEIEKRTDLLKSIVKEKYSDIVETSDAIQSMKLILQNVEKSIWSLDKSILDFYSRVKDPRIEVTRTGPIQQSKNSPSESTGDKDIKHEHIVKRLLRYSAEIWEQFDAGNLKQSVFLLEESLQLLDQEANELSGPEQLTFSNLNVTLNRTKEMIKNNLWHRIQSAAPDQIGVIAYSEEDQLYELSLNSSLEFLVKKLRNDLSDTSFHAQIRRYQPYSLFNSKTNEIEENVDEYKAGGYVQIPRYISPELSLFLFQVCKVVNTIVGFNLSRSSIVASLKVTIQLILDAYGDIVPLVDLLKAETKRKRALQLYYDLLYLRILLNSSKNIDLVDQLDVRITDVSSRYELMLDSIELYMISAALHSNVVKLSQSTIRLYGLLIPHLQ